MYLMKTSRSFHKIQEKSNIQKSFQLKIDMIYLLQAFLFSSTNLYQFILRKMSQDEASKESWNITLYSFLLRNDEKFKQKAFIISRYHCWPWKGPKRFWIEHKCLVGQHPVDSNSHIKPEIKRNFNSRNIMK